MDQSEEWVGFVLVILFCIQARYTCERSESQSCEQHYGGGGVPPPASPAAFAVTSVPGADLTSCHRQDALEAIPIFARWNMDYPGPGAPAGYFTGLISWSMYSSCQSEVVLIHSFFRPITEKPLLLNSEKLAVLLAGMLQ